MAEVLSTLSPAADQGTPANGGARYATMSAWENARQSDIVEGNTSVLECYGGDYGGLNGALEDELNLLDWSSTAVTDITIRAAAGEEHDGVSRASGGTGFAITGSSTTSAFQLFEFCTIQDIEILAVATSGTTAAVRILGIYNPKCLLERLILTANNVSRGLFVDGGNHAADVNDCIISSDSQWTANFNAGNTSSKTSLVQNCTILTVSGAFAIVMNSSVTVRNTVAIGGTTESFRVAPAAGSDCASDDASAVTYSIGTITGVVLTDATDFVEPSTGDYNVTQAGKLTGTGASPNLTANDIAGNPRNDPDDIGSYALVSAGPTPAVLSQHTTTGETATTATIGCTTDTSGGTLYWYLSESDQAPSSTDLKAGTGAVQASSLTPTAGQETVDLTGLDPATTYWHYWIQETT